MAQASLEDLEYAPRRELDRALMRQLATGRWIAEHRNVLITGATGVGKTYLACALGQHACRQGYRTIYRRLPRFFQELALARADGSYSTVLARLARVDVLILDDWGPAAVTDVQASGSPRGDGGSRRDPLDDNHEPASARLVAHVSRRPDHRRRRPRSPRPQRLSDHAEGPVATQGESLIRGTGRGPCPPPSSDDERRKNAERTPTVHQSLSLEANTG